MDHDSTVRDYPPHRDLPVVVCSHVDLIQKQEDPHSFVTRGLVVLKVHRQPVIQEEDINHFNIHSHTKTAFIIIGVSGDSVPL